VDVLRFRYAPRRLGTLVNDGGMLGNLRRSPWKLLLLPTFALALLRATRRQAKAWRPAVVHAHWLVPQGLLAVLAMTGMASAPPILVTSHGADLFALRGAFFDRCRKFVLYRVRHVTVVSAAMRDRLLALGGPGDAISVASMGVDFQSRFTSDPREPRSGNELLFVGRLVEKKGLRFLIDALPAIASAFPAVTLAVVGFGPEEEALGGQVPRSAQSP